MLASLKWAWIREIPCLSANNMPLDDRHPHLWIHLFWLNMAQGYVVLSQWAFALWWLALLSLHAGLAAYNALYALFYRSLEGTYLNTSLEFMSLGMPIPFHSKIVLAYSVIAACHGICLVMMICASMWHRSLRFWIEIPTLKQWQERTSRNMGKNTESSKIRVLWKVFHKIFARDGILGVDSPYFHTVLLIQESIETLLQTAQAYRMSIVLPRSSVNRFYVVLLVLNCFAPLIIHKIYKLGEPRKRLANIMCDCFLDLVVSVGIPVRIVLTYVGQYDTRLQGFPIEFWYDEVWVAHVQKEFQLVLVVSRADLFSRTVFSWGVLLASTHMKSLLAHSKSSSQVSSSRVLSNKSVKVAQAAGPTLLFVRHTTMRNTSIYEGSTLTTAVKGRPVLHRILTTQNAYYLFVAFGMTVLGFHIHAESRPSLSQCLLQVRPWGIDRPSCYLAELNCYHQDIQGLKNQVIDSWSAFDRETVAQLLVRHCPFFEMPPLIKDFTNLSGLKIYNSTIIEWASGAAFTNTHHPHLVTVYMVRVNFTDGVIPDGLLAQDFPPTLIDFEFVVTNLRDLPDSIDTIWPLGSSVYVEYGNLTSVPASLIRLQPYYMSLCGNPIRELPAELFETPNLLYLHVGSTLISELPRNVTAFSTSLYALYITNTNISSFWSWIDEMLSFPSTCILAAGTHYCTVLDQFLDSGDTDNFQTGALAPSELSNIMFPAKYSDLIENHISCYDGYSAPFFPLDVEDSNSAISAV